MWVGRWSHWDMLMADFCHRKHVFSYINHVTYTIKINVNIYEMYKMIPI